MVTTRREGLWWKLVLFLSSLLAYTRTDTHILQLVDCGNRLTGVVLWDRREKTRYVKTTIVVRLSATSTRTNDGWINKTNTYFTRRNATENGIFGSPRRRRGCWLCRKKTMGLFVAGGVVQSNTGRETDNSVVCKVYVRVFVGGEKDVCLCEYWPQRHVRFTRFSLFLCLFLFWYLPLFPVTTLSQYTWWRNYYRGNRRYHCLYNAID